MICLLTERRLHPGTFERFREAWDPPDGERPEQLVRAYHLRAVDDPDHVISFGLFDVTRQEFEALMADPEMAELQRARMAAMSEFIAEMGVDKAFEVADIVEGPRGEDDGALLA